MLGYFGKSSFVAPPPDATGGTPAAAVRAEIIPPAETLPVQTAPEAAPPSEIELQLAQLRQAVEAKRLAKEMEVRNIQEMHRKQAAYGRDTAQLRPPEAGYATEAEKLMGGQTGYYKLVTEASQPALSGFGQAVVTSKTAQVTKLTKEVIRLTDVVKQLTKDVAAGVAPRSELVKAIQVLQTKAQEAKKVTSQLSGLTDAPPSKLLWGGALLLGGFLVYRCCF